ncbi:MAG: tRNA dihydrouridine synthase DusB [Acidimicrobiales bacterium]
MSTAAAVRPSVGRALAMGPLEIDPPVVLAPMAGVTNVPFRRLCRSYGAGLYVSEMIAARALVEGNPKTLAMASFADDDPVRSVQLYAVDPRVARDAVRRLVAEVGVDHVDLNFGCPVAKVTRLGGGAALPVHRNLFRSILRVVVRAAGAVPVSVKLRKGTDASHLTYLESGRIAEDEGVAAVTLHARTAEQYYSGRADWDAIAALKGVVSIPVLGNGDIWEAADALAMTVATGCDGVVIGRGCLGRPWLFGDLADAFAGRAPRDAPGLGEVMEVMRTHARMLCEFFGEDAGTRQFRKHAGWYLTGFPVGPAIRRSLGLASSLDEIDELLRGVDPALPFPPEAARIARGHTNGPRPVRLPDGWYADADDATPPAGGEAVSGG